MIESPCEDPFLACFLDSLELATIFSGTESDWILPEIFEGSEILTEVRFEPDSFIAPYLSYDSENNEVSYDGFEISALTFVNIDITLVNSLSENPYTMQVIVYPSIEESVTESEEEKEEEEEKEAETPSEEVLEDDPEGSEEDASDDVVDEKSTTFRAPLSY